MRNIVALGALTAVLALPSAALAAPYPPPSHSDGTASPSRVKQGHCTDFRGDGFAAGAALTITDDGDHYGNTLAGDNGKFSFRVCFAADAEVGEHVLAATGTAAQTAPTDPDQHEVTATVTVTGLEQSGNGNGKGPDAAAVNARNAASSSGIEVVSPFGLAALALLVTPLVTGALLVLERRHRARRRAA